MPHNTFVQTQSYDQAVREKEQQGRAAQNKFSLQGLKEALVCFRLGKTFGLFFPGGSRSSEQAANSLVPLFPLRRSSYNEQRQNT